VDINVCRLNCRPSVTDVSCAFRELEVLSTLVQGLFCFWERFIKGCEEDNRGLSNWKCVIFSEIPLSSVHSCYRAS